MLTGARTHRFASSLPWRAGSSIRMHAARPPSWQSGCIQLDRRSGLGLAKAASCEPTAPPNTRMCRRAGDIATMQVVYWIGRYDGAASFDLSAASGPHILDLGNVLYAPTCMKDPRDPAVSPARIPKQFASPGVQSTCARDGWRGMVLGRVKAASTCSRVGGRNFTRGHSKVAARALELLTLHARMQHGLRRAGTLCGHTCASCAPCRPHPASAATTATPAARPSHKRCTSMAAGCSRWAGRHAGHALQLSPMCWWRVACTPSSLVVGPRRPSLGNVNGSSCLPAVQHNIRGRLRTPLPTPGAGSERRPPHACTALPRAAACCCWSLQLPMPELARLRVGLPAEHLHRAQLSAKMAWELPLPRQPPPPPPSKAPSCLPDAASASSGGGTALEGSCGSCCGCASAGVDRALHLELELTLE